MKKKEIIWEKRSGDWFCRIDGLMCYCQSPMLGKMGIWSETNRRKGSMIGAFRVKGLVL